MYNFDKIINRENTDSVAVDGYKDALFNNMDIKTTHNPISMWIADMQFETPYFVFDAIKERLEHKILGYTRVYDENYYNVFQKWCQKQYNFSFNKEELVMSNGIVPAIYDIITFTCNKGDNVLYLTPSYGHFKNACDLAFVNSTYSKMINNDNEYSIDFVDLEQKASNPNTKLFILCNPHNPTGRVFSSEELKRIDEIMQKHNVWVISDEIHCDLLRYDHKHIPFATISNYDRLITCMSAGKTFNIAGLMVSNIIIRNKELRDTWLLRHNNSDNPLSISASKACYEFGYDYKIALNKYIDNNFNYTINFVKENLKLAKITIPQATYLAWIDLSKYNIKENLVEFFAKNNVLLQAGNEMFVRDATNFIRLNLACPFEVLKEALIYISNALNSL